MSTPSTATRWDPSLVSAELLSLTRLLGDPDRDLVILAEGNTSQLLSDGRVVVKTSGSGMARATAEDFAVVDTGRVLDLLRDPAATQEDLSAALDAGEHAGRRRRASIETPVHVAARAVEAVEFVGHTHPTAVTGLLAGRHAARAWESFAYSDEAVVLGRPLFVPYAQPGIDLGRDYLAAVARHADRYGELPRLVLLGNHGIVVNAPTAEAVDAITRMTVKAALVRLAAAAAGGVRPLPADSVASFFARSDIADRSRALRGGTRP
ncbi:class II aldolase/adducin family protein [Kineococcus sp. SYSU DK018]|uniref:class II aldolase/adducin family protein n=1 Tax=Kineococcus sp. SYSU DK018 TaxID=3383139 RepID=UPI003D7CCC96